MAALLFPAVASAQVFDPVIDSPMYKSPDLPMPVVEIVFPTEFAELWLGALKRPETEMQLQAAMTISRAHRRGMKGLESSVAPLIATLDKPDQHPAVRIAAAQALIDLDARQSAKSFFAHVETGDLELREVLEPALGRWDYRPTRAVWLERIRQPATPPRSLVLAIEGLAAVREEGAALRLRELTLSDHATGPIRLAAGRALGAIVADGLVKDAEALAADATPRGLVGRLAAALMLRRHTSPPAIAVLQRLARDSEPAVAAIAAARLIEIDPGQAIPVLDRLIASSGPKVRSLGVEVLFRLPTNERIRLLADRLADLHPDVRRQARASLQTLAMKKEFESVIQSETVRVLDGKDWRGLEQAIILLAQLDYRPAAPRMADLLTADRPEVNVTAAWALRKLAVSDTLPRVLKHVQAKLKLLGPPPSGPAGKVPPPNPPPGILVDHQLSQLNQFLGQAKYSPAEPALRQFVPKRPFMGETRAAAIWALGMIHADKAPPDLVAALEGRLQDMGLPPEDTRVRRMVPITLGRMKAAKALPILQKYYSGQASEDETSNACGWAIEQLTGKAMAPPEPIRRTPLDWFQIPSK